MEEYVGKHADLIYNILKAQQLYGICGPHFAEDYEIQEGIVLLCIMNQLT
jgi:hypothetical protein